MSNEAWITKALDVAWQYAPFVIIAMWGGTVNYISKIRSSKEKFDIVVLIGEWSTSGFAGLLAGVACVRMDMTWEASMFVVGMAGHASARSLFLMQKVYEKWLGDQSSLGGKK